LDAFLAKLPLVMDKSGAGSAGLAALGESEALWYLGLLSASARFGGDLLPPRRTALEARMQAALGDKRRLVRKAGAKLCRRVLMGLTAPFSGDLTGHGTLEEALHRWSGARTLEWGSPLGPVRFHVPSPEELEFARSLCDWALKAIAELAEGSDEDIYASLTLAKSLVRGVACLYPDERQGEDACPLVSMLPNELGPRILTEIASVLTALCPRLGSPKHPLDAEAAVPESSSRPKLLCKALRMIVGLVRGERRPEIPDMLQIRGFEGNVRARVSSESATQKVHYMSAWRDVSRFFYNWEVLSLMNRRLHIRPTGFKHEGLRKQLRS
jgi:hypothetical protein